MSPHRLTASSASDAPLLWHIPCQRASFTVSDCESFGRGRLRTRRFSMAAAAAAASAPDAAAAASSTGRGTIVPFLLADIGEGIAEVELLQWFVQEGDTVRQFDRVCEVQSDKATVEITSRFDGVVVERSGGSVGDLVRVGQPLLLLRTDGGADGEDATPTALEAHNETVDVQDRLSIPTVGSQFHLRSDDENEGADNAEGSSTTAAPSTSPPAKFQASPAVRKIGADHGLDLATVKPSGPHGRLLKADVVTYLKEQGLWQGDRNGESAAAEAPATTEPSVPGVPCASTAAAAAGQDQIVQLKGYNRLMVQTMTAALQIPHMGFADELVLDRLLECRRELNASTAVAAADAPDAPTNISMLVLLAKATSLALLEVPAVNAVVHSAADYQIQIRADHNLGIAMDTPRGLVVPVLKRVQTKSLRQLQAELDELKALAARSALTPDHLSDGTLTLSNIGSLGCGTYMHPVIVTPQLAVGALGSLRTVPRFAEDASGTMDTSRVVAARVLPVSWAADHRFLDGATLARFHAAFKRNVEHPLQMLARLK